MRAAVPPKGRPDSVVVEGARVRLLGSGVWADAVAQVLCRQPRSGSCGNA